MKPKCKCGETKDLKTWALRPRLRLSCGSCGRTFVAVPHKREIKQLTPEEQSIYRLLNGEKTK